MVRGTFTSDTGAAACGDPATIELVRGLVCESVDIQTDDDQSCTSVSVGGGFTAVPAALGRVRARAQQPVECPDAGDDGACE